MGEIKPLGSEKLTGDDKMKRILELTYYQNPVNENKKSNRNFELIEETPLAVYGISKEKDGYYVKKGINESTLDYIGGLFMKNKNRFSSYADALKRLEFLKGQEQLNEATKYVLKKPASSTTEAPTPESPIPSPSPEALPEPTNTGAEETPTEVPDETGEEGNNEFSADMTGDTLKSIQKLTGKLGQKLREYDEEIKSDDIKYVLNMVLSAVDLQKLEDNDKEEILGKLEGDDEDSGIESPEGEEIPPVSGEELPTQEPEDELGEISNKLEEFTEADFDFGDDDEPDFDDYENTDFETYRSDVGDIDSKYDGYHGFDAGEPIMTHSQYRDYSEPSEPDNDNFNGEYDEEQNAKSIISAIQENFATILDSAGNNEYILPTKGNLDFMLFFGNDNTVSGSIYNVSNNKELNFPATHIEDLDVNKLIGFFEPYRNYILTGDELERYLESENNDKFNDMKYSKQERNYSIFEMDETDISTNLENEDQNLLDFIRSLDDGDDNEISEEDDFTSDLETDFFGDDQDSIQPRRVYQRADEVELEEEDDLTDIFDEPYSDELSINEIRNIIKKKFKK